MATANALRREIGRELDLMRHRAEIPASDIRVAKICGSTRTFVRLAKGERTKLTYPAIGALCDLFGAGEGKKFEFQRLWDVLDNTSFAESAEALVKSGFSPYLGFERIAVGLDQHEVMFVPGLFQTERYASWIHQNDPFLEHSQAQRLTALRMQRQRDFEERGEAVRVRALLQEGVLRNGCDQEQLDWLVELDSRPNISISYIPFGPGPHPALAASFAILSFTDRQDPDLVYFEAPGESRFVETAEPVLACRRSFEAGIDKASTIREFVL